MGFFTELERPLQAYLDALKREQGDKEFDEKRRLLYGVLNSMIESPEDYEHHALLTANWVGSSLKASLINKDFSDAAIERTLATAARIIREVTIRRSSYSTLESEILDYYINPKTELTGDSLSQADYIRNGLPISIQKDLLDKLAHAERSAKSTKDSLFERVQDLEARIEAHRAELKKLETNYNFVGLTAAFQRLLIIKGREKLMAFGAVVLLGGAAVGIPAAVLFARSSGSKFLLLDTTWSPTVVAGLIAVVGIEIVSLYFFRIALRNYQVARAHITSLQLRSALCAFIESYLDFKKRQGGKDTEALFGFEQLIFAGLIDGEAGLPPTIEGLAQIADIVRAAKA